MNASALVAIGGGAVLGAWLRYALGLWLNPVLPAMPLGTLAANLVGGYLIGAAVAVFHINVELPAELKLFFITGFLGASGVPACCCVAGPGRPDQWRPAYLPALRSASMTWRMKLEGLSASAMAGGGLRQSRNSSGSVKSPQ